MSVSPFEAKVMQGMKCAGGCARYERTGRRRTVEWLLGGAIVAAGILAGAAIAKAAQAGNSTRIVIDYPINESVFPPDMAAPTFLWRDDSASAESWRIDISFADGSAELHVTSKGEHMKIGEIDPRCISSTNKLPELTPEQAAAHTWVPDAAIWAAIRQHAVEHAATITVSSLAGGNALAAASSASIQLHVSADPVG